MLRERQDAEYQELHKTIKYMNAKQGGSWPRWSESKS